jgi:hypothetical protein
VVFPEWKAPNGGSDRVDTNSTYDAERKPCSGCAGEDGPKQLTSEMAVKRKAGDAGSNRNGRTGF